MTDSDRLPDMGGDIETRPIDDRTGLRAIAVLPSGRVAWPILGGDGTDGGDDAGAADEGGEPEGDGDTQVDWEKETAKLKALSRKHEAEAKKNATAARRLAEAEEADKTEAQKAADRAAQAEERATKAEARAMRLEVAAAKGLSLQMASRLQGETQEELEADADQLLQELRPATAPGQSGDRPGARPREQLRSGTAPDAPPEENDPAKLAAMVPRG